MLSSNIYSHGFKSIPANYKNPLTANYIKSYTSYGSSMQSRPADPLTPKPNIHFFLKGNGQLFHHPHMSWRMPSHPPTNTFSDVRSSPFTQFGAGRRHGGKSRSSRRSIRHHELFNNDMFDLSPPNAMGRPGGGAKPPPSKYNHRTATASNNIFQLQPTGYQRFKSSFSNYGNSRSLSTAKALQGKKTWYYQSLDR